MHRITILFRKAEGARFLSHLDLLATLEYSIRRARLPVALSEGFNPRPRMSLAAALPLGHIGEREILELTLREYVAPEEVSIRLSESLPAGIRVISAEETSIQAKAAGSRLHSVVYRVELDHPIYDLSAQLTKILDRASIEVEEQREGKTRMRDLRPLILSLDAVGDGIITMHLRFQDGGTARPEQILELLGVQLEGAELIRERIEVHDS